MSRKPQPSPEAMERIERIARIRYAIPTDKELAKELGLTRWMVHEAMKRFRKKLPTIFGDNQITPNDGEINA